jgi:arabinogalactan oligomer/maltooligosaccharide transport system permease protein
MTATADLAPNTAPDAFHAGLLARAVAWFSGGVGLTLKIAFLCLSNALAVWAAYVLTTRSDWVSVGVLAVATLAIDAVYLIPWTWTPPAKFLVPGSVFLIAFQIVPILYTVSVAFSNYSTGHILSKSNAIATIQENSLQPPPNGKQYEMAPARDPHGRLVMILHDDATGAVFAGDTHGLMPLAKSAVKVNSSGEPTSAAGYTLVKGADLFKLDAQLQSFDIPTHGKAALKPQGFSTAIELEPTLRYDKRRDEFVRISDGLIFKNDGRGSFVAANDPKNELEPGWKTGVGFRNFTEILRDPLVRTPFISVFIFTIVFATSVVFLSFAAGLFLAIALDKKGMRLQRLYRTALVVPYAVPGFLSLLVWAGLLNDDFGVVNRLLGHIGLHFPFLFGANMARISVIGVSIWLTVPYFFLVSLATLQSIPVELTEAATVDGGGSWQIFRRVTLPLLLVSVAPLMIASFALNFNNFNNIYLLTGGGPYAGTSSIAGSTDILISYTYKIAIATGKGQDYGLASALSIIIFFIVAGISGVSFWRTKALEAVN